MKYEFGEVVRGENWDYDVYMTCPVCGKGAVLTCKCPYRDCVCPDGHKWHLDPQTGTLLEGSGHDG